MKTCSLVVTAFETLHVQQPYSRTDLKSRNIKLVLKLLRHTTDNIPNAALALLIHPHFDVHIGTTICSNNATKVSKMVDCFNFNNSVYATSKT